MVVGPVGPGDPRSRPGHPDIGDHGDAGALLAPGPDVPLDQGRVGSEVGLLEQAPASGQAGLPVAGDQDEHGVAVGVDHGQALQQVGMGDGGIVEERHHLVDPGPSRRVVLDRGRERRRRAATGSPKPPRPAASTLAA